MSKCEEIIDRIKAKAEAQAKKDMASDEIFNPKDVNLANLNEKNNETIERISREKENDLEK